MDGLDLIDWPADRVLSLSTIDGALKVPVSLRHASGRLASGAVAMAEFRLGADGRALRVDPIAVALTPAHDGAANAKVRLRIDPATPPGLYRGEMSIAGVVRPLEVEVTARTALRLRPAPLVMDVSQGVEQHFGVLFENLGNTVLTIDVTGEYPLGVEDPLRGGAEPPPRDDDVMAVLLERSGGAISGRSLTPAGAARLFMPDGPFELSAGATRSTPVAVTVPDQLQPTARHHLFAPVYTGDLHIIVVSAAKPPAPGGRKRQGTVK